MINSLKSMVETKISEKKEYFENESIEKQVSSSEKIDITMPVDTESGSLHPRTIVQAELEDIFKSMGFVVEDGNEVVTEYECFDSVNVPSTHPARDMQDTFCPRKSADMIRMIMSKTNDIYGVRAPALFLHGNLGTLPTVNQYTLSIVTHHKGSKPSVRQRHHSSRSKQTNI